MRRARDNETADHPMLNGDKGGRVFWTSAAEGVSARSIFGSESVEILLRQQSPVGHLPRPNVDTSYLTCIIGSRFAHLGHPFSIRNAKLGARSWGGLFLTVLVVRNGQPVALSSLKGRGFVNRVVDQWFCWLSASG